jgi:catechol 2,3-dioxygenase-like lactoylglutathione lyase family enzyme
VKLYRLVLAALLAIVLPSASSRAQAITRVEAVGFTVSDMDRSVDFFTRVLHFRKVSDDELCGRSIEQYKALFGLRERVVRLQLGSETLELTQYLAPQSRAIPADFGSNELSFQHIAIVVRDMDRAYVWLRENHIEHVSSGPQTLPAWNKNAAGIQAFYFKDPDGHVLEIIHFPSGKGDPRWQAPGDDLFEGIDHTAIGVSDTDRSLAFYRDTLGMHIVGTSENYGDEQEHLNAVFGAHLRITSLHAAQGPGVELLEYITPRTARPIPADARASDIAHWETIVDEPDTAAAWDQLRDGRVRLISPGIAKIGARTGFLFADPDGHVLAAVQ